MTVVATHRQTIRSLLTSAAMLVVLSSFAGCSKSERPARHVTLSTGQKVKILSVGQMRFTSGPPAMVVKYETAIPLADRERVSAEADMIWADFRRDVERAKLTNAVISATSVQSSGLISRSNSSHNFVYQRDANGEWRRLPSR
jgi:hypothetical protein